MMSRCEMDNVLDRLGDREIGIRPQSAERLTEMLLARDRRGRFSVPGGSQPVSPRVSTSSRWPIQQPLSGQLTHRFGTNE